MFAQFLSCSFGSITTANNYISGVKLVHILTGLSFPKIDGVEFQLMVKRLKKLNTFTPSQALPIAPNVLLDMFKVMDVSTQPGCTLKCVCV